MNTTSPRTPKSMQKLGQAGAMAPDRSFKALQTVSGNSLLFSIGADGVLYLTQETPGHRTGWTRADLSSAQIASDFPDTAAPLACTGFDAAQNPHSGSIGLAMVVGKDGASHLYLSLGNVNPDAPWSVQWTAYPYDNPHQTMPALAIVGVFLSEADDGQYVVVDVSREPSSAAGPVSRFYIDTAMDEGYAWRPLPGAIGLERGGYASCLGRRAGQLVDGVYTIGRGEKLPQLQYQPLYNAFDPRLPAPPSVYVMPGGAPPEALAAARNADDTTDLYLSAAGALYYLGAAQQQHEGAAPVLLNADPEFIGVSELYAAVSNGEVVVWGLNRARQLFSMSCPIGRQADAAAWTAPLLVLADVERFSPYLNMANEANSIVVRTCGNEITKAVKPPYTNSWRFEKIAPTGMDRHAATQRFKASAAPIRLNGADGPPLSNVRAEPASITRAPVCVDNPFMVLPWLSGSTAWRLARSRT